MTAKAKLSAVQAFLLAALIGAAVVWVFFPQQVRDFVNPITPLDEPKKEKPAKDGEKGAVDDGGNNPSGQPGPPKGGRKEPPQPTPVTPQPTPTPPQNPGNSQICIPGVLPVLPAVCLN